MLTDGRQPDIVGGWGLSRFCWSSLPNGFRFSKLSLLMNLWITCEMNDTKRQPENAEPQRSYMLTDFWPSNTWACSFDLSDRCSKPADTCTESHTQLLLRLHFYTIIFISPENLKQYCLHLVKHGCFSSLYISLASCNQAMTVWLRPYLYRDTSSFS